MPLESVCWGSDLLTAGAHASFQLGHVDLAGGLVEQDACIVQTKFAKTFRTYFMPVRDQSILDYRYDPTLGQLVSERGQAVPTSR